MYFVTPLLGILTVVSFKATAGKVPVQPNSQSEKVKGILSPTIKVIQIAGEYDHMHHSVWYPTSTELEKANNMNNVEKRIAVNKLFDIDGNPQMKAELVDGQITSYSSGSGNPFLLKLAKSFLEYKDSQRSYKQNNRRRRNIQNGSSVEPVTAVVELSIVCDKSFSAIFHNNRQKILEYFTMYMWEVNMAFKSLLSSYILIRVTSIIIITDNAAQPFIEVSRAENGSVSLKRILDPFGDYMKQHIGVFPQFDAAIAVTSEPADFEGVWHYVATACKVWNRTRFTGILILHDKGKLESIRLATSGLAQVLGADYDKEIGGCNTTEYILRGGKHFFSSCSDNDINEYIRSENGKCLRDTVNLADAVLDPYYNNVPVLSLTDQCRLRWDNVRAYIDDEDMPLCNDIPCRVWKNGTEHVRRFHAVGNSPCGRHRGRCFRGSCLEPDEIDDIMRISSSIRCQRFSARFVYDDRGKLMDCQPANEPSSGIVIRGYVSFVFLLKTVMYILY